MGALSMMPHSHALDTHSRRQSGGLKGGYIKSLAPGHISPRVLTTTRHHAASIASKLSASASANSVVSEENNIIGDTIITNSNRCLRVALPASVRGFGREYCSALESWPLRTNAFTSALFFALGDVVAQITTASHVTGICSTPWFLRPLMLDFLRIVKHAFTGVGYGVIWSYW